MKINTIANLGLVVSALSFGVAAHAGAGSSQLDFSSLKAKCVELSGNQQLKPFKAIVTCRDVQHVWREAPSKAEQSLKNAREVGATIRMKGFETPYQGSPVDLAPTQAKCVVMEKIKVSVPAVDAELSCDDLNGIEDLTQYCLEQITQRTEEDPSLTIEEGTGETINLCNGNALQNISEEQQK